MDLISSAELTLEQIREIFRIADMLKEGKEPLMVGPETTIGIYFEKQSTRTRVAFEAAIAQLGGIPIFINAADTHSTRGESISDIAKVLGGYCDMIVARVLKHSEIVEMADATEKPVINALTDIEHPTQALADVYTIVEKCGRIKGLTIAFVGDIATNTANSLMLTASKLGATVRLVGPKEVQPNHGYLIKAREYGKVEVYDDVNDGVDGADIIYTDTFVSMGKEGEGRTEEEDVRSLPGQRRVAEACEPRCLRYALPSCLQGRGDNGGGHRRTAQHCLAAVEEQAASRQGGDPFPCRAVTISAAHTR